MNTLSDNQYRRLTLSKYLFGQATRILRHAGPYSRGLATSLLQDCVEVFLRVLIERNRLEVSRRENFHQLIDTVGKCVEGVGGHSASLKRLNTARVGFKHEGLDVARTDVEAVLASVEAFLSEICDQEFGIDFTTLSLVGAIGHRRTQNWFEKARKALDSNLHVESVAHSAAAMAVYLHHRDDRRSERTDPSYYIDLGSRELGSIADWVLEYVEPIRNRLDLVSNGIDVSLYDRFEALTPATSIGQYGVVSQHKSRFTPDPSAADARFCYDFAVESVLALRDVGVPSGFHQWRDANCERVRVIAPCHLIVHPRADPPEVIRIVRPDEELLVAPKSQIRRIPHNDSEFVRILQDGDIAHVRRDCLQVGFDLAESTDRTVQ